MAKKKGKIERSIHFYDVTMQRLGTEKEDAFVNYKNQEQKAITVFEYFQNIDREIKKEKSKAKKLELLGKIEYKRLFDLLSDNIDHYSVSSPCSKFYKRNIIQENQIRFHENLCFGEDSLFVKTYLLNVNSVISVKDLYYHYQDIGDDIYHKYSKSFEPVLLYYYEMIKMYDKFERLKKISISKNKIVSVVFNIANICLFKNGLKEVKHVREFLSNHFAQIELSRRNSIHIKVVLLLSHLPKGYMLLLYIRLVNAIKSLQ